MGTINQLEGDPTSSLHPIPDSFLTSASGTDAHNVHVELDRFCVRHSGGLMNGFRCYRPGSVYSYKTKFFSNISVRFPLQSAQRGFFTCQAPICRGFSFLQTPRTRHFMHLDLHCAPL